MPTPDPEFEQFYSSSYPRLVVMLRAIGTRHDDVEAVAHDAFVLTFGKWSSVSRYENPHAYVRKVALGLVSNQRRKLRNTAKAWMRHGPTAESTPAASGVGLDVRRTLLALPFTMRVVLVMHYYLDLDLKQIAAELDIPIGTVKSRLSRAKAQFIRQYQGDVDCVR